MRYKKQPSTDCRLTIPYQIRIPVMSTNDACVLSVVNADAEPGNSHLIASRVGMNPHVCRLRGDSWMRSIQWS